MRSAEWKRLWRERTPRADALGWSRAAYHTEYRCTECPPMISSSGLTGPDPDERFTERAGLMRAPSNSEWSSSQETAEQIPSQENAQFKDKPSSGMATRRCRCLESCICDSAKDPPNAPSALRMANGEDEHSKSSVAALERSSTAPGSSSRSRPGDRRASSYTRAADARLWSRLHTRGLTEDESSRALELPKIQALIERILWAFSRDYQLPRLSVASTYDTLRGYEASLAMRRALGTYRPGPQAFESWAWRVVRNALKRVRAQYVEKGPSCASYDGLSNGLDAIDPRFIRALVPDTWTDEARRRFFGFLAEEEIASLPVSESAKQTAFQLYVEGRTRTMVAQGRLVNGKRGCPATSVQSVTRYRVEFDAALERRWRAQNVEGVLPRETKLWRLLNVPVRPRLGRLAEAVVQSGPVLTRRLADLTDYELSDLEARFPSFRR